jgi:pimeloyl-ACP methyl ester carboxylesterase
MSRDDAGDALLPRLVLMHGPGIGGEAFRFQRSIRARVETPVYLRHEPGESLESYALRMAETIDPTPPLYLGGVSFGGMVALEAAKVLRPRGVFLIASGSSGRQVHAVLQHVLQPIAPRVPLWLYRASRWMLPPVLRLAFMRAPRASRDLLIELLQHHTDFDIWRRGIESIRRWEFHGELDMPVYHIHGDNDWLMPLDQAQSVDAVVLNGPHLMNISHPAPVNAFIEQRLGGRSK